MNKTIILITSLFCLLLIACESEEYLLCADNVTRVIDLEDCPKPKPQCPICEINETCTQASCGPTTDYKCEYSEIIPCDGNGVCEEGEFTNSVDCPANCDDSDACTNDIYNYRLSKCQHQPLSPCCGNNKCDRGETFVNCPLDCEQALDITISKYTKLQRISSIEQDLLDSPYVYLVVDIFIKNIGIENEHTIDYGTQEGFYYDPFKMRLEIEGGSQLNIEYDSDLLDNYLDYTVIPKGHTKQGQILFIVPESAKHVRLAAYDKFGSKLDVVEIY